MADEENKNVNGPDDQGTTAETDEAHGESTPLVDEYGEPLADEHEHARKRPLYRRPAFLIGASLILLLAILFGVRYWAYARSHETTDDAFIDGDIIQVSPKVSGYVTKIYIKANQDVKAGDLLLEIDDRDLQAKVDQAKAAFSAGMAQQKQARTQVTLTRVTGRANVRQAAAGVQQARSGVGGARAGAASERNRITQSSAGINTAEANMQQARAQLGAAQAEAVRANADVQRYQTLLIRMKFPDNVWIRRLLPRAPRMPRLRLPSKRSLLWRPRSPRRAPRLRPRLPTLNVLNLRSERRARRSTKRWAGSIKRTPRRNRWP